MTDTTTPDTAPLPVPTPGMSQREAHICLGNIMLAEAGVQACEEGYGTADPEWVGRYALGYGDINADGTTN